MRISIVIPVYNEAKYIAACLDSIAAQTVKPYEVIVVNNNSTDRTVEIASRYPFVQVMDEARQGTAYARNTGFRAARGDIIGRIDGDSVLSPDWVRVVRDFFVSDAAGRYVGVTGWIKPDGMNQKMSLWLARIVFFGGGKLLHYTQVFYGGSMAFRAAALPMVWQYAHVRPDIHEDVDLARIFAGLGRIAYLPMLAVRVDFKGTVGGLGKRLHYFVMLVSWWRYP
jgi:glycosyltransferase involved in cell wall biosynthesis